MISFKNKKTCLKISVLLVMLFLFFIAPCAVPDASAGPKAYVAGIADKVADKMITTVVDSFSNMIDWILIGCLQLMQACSGAILAIGMALVDLTLSDKLYDQVFFAPASVAAMNTGWGLVRDFVNMFFILILIFIAIATILRVNKFSDKKMIVYVVSAALFVNFSKPITMFVIDISNLAMSFFMSNIREGNAAYSAVLMDAGGMGELMKSDTAEAGTLGMMVSWMIESMFKATMGFMLMTLGLSLVIRLIALWVLIILSPLAFFAIALPGTAVGGMKDKWFKSLTYWCFYGPIMLFFFWLSLVLVSAVGTTVFAGGGELQMSSLNDQGFIIGGFKILLPYVSCLYMLYYGFTLAQDMAKSGAGGAAWALGKTGSLAKGAAFGATAGYGFGYGKAAYNNAKERVSGNLAAGNLQKKAIVPGGKLSNVQHKSNLVDEETKKWDEKGTPSKEQLAKIMDKSPSFGKTLGNVVGATETRTQAVARQKAAAIKLAEGGNLAAGGGSGSYEKAVGLFKNDPKNLEKFQKAAEKKNRGAMIEHEVGQEVRQSVDGKVNDVNSRGGSVMSPEVEAAFRNNQERNISKKKYEEHLKKMKLSDITDQEAGFLEKREVKEYIKERQEAKDERFNSKNIRRKIGEGLDGEKQEALEEFITREDE